MQAAYQFCRSPRSMFLDLTDCQTIMTCANLKDMKVSFCSLDTSYCTWAKAKYLISFLRSSLKSQNRQKWTYNRGWKWVYTLRKLFLRCKRSKNNWVFFVLYNNVFFKLLKNWYNFSIIFFQNFWGILKGIFSDINRTNKFRPSVSDELNTNSWGLDEVKKPILWTIVLQQTCIKGTSSMHCSVLKKNQLIC